MAFRQVNFEHLAKFNSEASSILINKYKDQLIVNIQSECAGPKSCTFAPSSMRCNRKSWFRLRGTQPDFIAEPDLVLNHTAVVGTALHEHIQSVLEQAFGADWVSVEDYLKENPIPYEYVLTQNGHETLVEIPEIPIKFACDGILRIHGKYYLLEIKSSEYSSWDKLTTTKPHHIDQIETYSTILNIPNVLTLYVDRQFGDVKSYEHTIPLEHMIAVNDRIAYVKRMVEMNLAPDRLPVNDYMCLNCEYKNKCKEWG